MSTAQPANTNLPADGFVLPFQLVSSAIRGRLVRLGPALDAILHRHDYPAAVGQLLGETMTIAAALGTALKFDGVFTLQAKSDGAVRLLVADVTSNGSLRAYAQFDADKLSGPDAKLVGDGYLVFTVDQAAKDDRYQGIVALEGASIATAVQHYFRQSEQLPTGIIVAVKQDEAGHWCGGCLMLQRMPRDGGAAVTSDTSVEDDWIRAMMLMQTCAPEELLDPNVTAEQLLLRLFHEEGVMVYEAHPFHHACRCSETRVSNMLRGLPRAEVEDMAVNKVVTITCEFCNRSYDYDKPSLDALYDEQPVADSAGTKPV